MAVDLGKILGKASEVPRIQPRRARADSLGREHEGFERRAGRVDRTRGEKRGEAKEKGKKRDAEKGNEEQPVGKVFVDRLFRLLDKLLFSSSAREQMFTRERYANRPFFIRFLFFVLFPSSSFFREVRREGASRREVVWVKEEGTWGTRFAFLFSVSH